MADAADVLQFRRIAVIKVENRIFFHMLDETPADGIAPERVRQPKGVVLLLANTFPFDASQGVREAKGVIALFPLFGVSGMAAFP